MDVGTIRDSSKKSYIFNENFWSDFDAESVIFLKFSILFFSYVVVIFYFSTFLIGLLFFVTYLYTIA